jgi:hypothetical protein
MNRAVDTEDKQAWCEEFGIQVEAEFVIRALNSGLTVSMNPDKRTNPYTHDLVAHLPADLKTVRTPFFTATRFGFDPLVTVTLNTKDVRHYAAHPAFLLFFDVHWDEQSMLGTTVPPQHGLWMADMRLVSRLIDRGRCPLHTYQRRENDGRGNGRDSYLLNLEWFTRLE